jgi:hypothetical protein
MIHLHNHAPAQEKHLLVSLSQALIGLKYAGQADI